MQLFWNNHNIWCRTMDNENFYLLYLPIKNAFRTSGSQTHTELYRSMALAFWGAWLRMGSENLYIYKAPQGILMHNHVWEPFIQIILWGNQAMREMWWANVREGHRIEEIAKKEDCGQRERFQGIVLVNIVAESKLSGKYVVRRKVEGSRDSRRSE